MAATFFYQRAEGEMQARISHVSFWCVGCDAESTSAVLEEDGWHCRTCNGANVKAIARHGDDQVIATYTTMES